jgi:hypothetical protein
MFADLPMRLYKQKVFVLEEQTMLVSNLAFEAPSLLRTLVLGSHLHEGHHLGDFRHL